MATTSIWSIKGQLGNVVEYVKNPEKTESLGEVLGYAVNGTKTERKHYVSGINSFGRCRWRPPPPGARTTTVTSGIWRSCRPMSFSSTSKPAFIRSGALPPNPRSLSLLFPGKAKKKTTPNSVAFPANLAGRSGRSPPLPYPPAE